MKKCTRLPDIYHLKYFHDKQYKNNNEINPSDKIFFKNKDITGLAKTSCHSDFYYHYCVPESQTLKSYYIVYRKC